MVKTPSEEPGMSVHAETGVFVPSAEDFVESGCF
jgi:hypothetical protein